MIQNNSQTKKCPRCQQVVDIKAKKCQYCSSDIRNWFARHPIITTLLIIIILPPIIGSFGSSRNAADNAKRTGSATSTQNNQVKAADTTVATSTRSKVDAQKELDDLMAMSQKAGLIDSYEFSKLGNVIYIGPIWYTQKVTFKKDFIAKVAMLKKELTGYWAFEVRDAQSNEKVAEVTSFSGSLEIYK